MGILKMNFNDKPELYFNIDFNTVLEERWFRNFEITFENDDFSWRSNRIVFAVRNEFFKKKLADNPDRVVINDGYKIKNKKLTMELVENYFMFNKIDLNDDNIEDVINFSLLIEQDDLLTRCITYSKRWISEKNFLQYSKLELPEVNKLSRLFVKKYFELVYDSDQMLKVDFDFLMDILKSDKLNVGNEELAFDTLERWITYDGPNRLPYFDILIETIRLNVLSDKFLNERVKPLYNKCGYKYPEEIPEPIYADRRRVTLEDIAANFEEAISYDEFLELAYEEFRQLIRLLPVDVSQELIYSNIKQWIAYDENRKRFLNQLLDCMDWDILTIKYILDIFEECEFSSTLWKALKKKILIDGVH